MADKEIAEAFASDTDSERIAREVHTPPWWKFGTKDFSHVSIDGDYVSKKEGDANDEQVIKRRNSVFQSPEAFELYRPPATYEGAHRFDPTLVWTETEEKALVRKVLCSQQTLWLLMHASSTGGSLLPLASCSSLYNSIEAISYKHWLTTCSLTLV